MGNFLQDVGRSTFQGSIKDMIQTKLMIDQDERTAVTSANANALNAEQLIQAKRANEVAAEKVKDLNTPIPIKILKMGMVDDGEGPITNYVEEKAKALGLIDYTTNPDAPSILKKHIMPGGDVEKFMTQDIHKVHSLTTQYANTLIDQAKELQAKNPNDKQASAMMDKGTRLLTQMTMAGPELEAAKLKSTEAVHAATNATSIANNAATNAAHLQASQNSAAATIKAAQLRLDHEKANDPTAKMPPRVKLAFDWMKTFQAKTQPTNLLMYLASTGDATAKADIQKMQDFGKDPENIRLALKYSKLVEDYISGIENQDEIKSDDKPRELTESDILFNMKQYGKTREQVKAKFNQLYKREH